MLGGGAMCGVYSGEQRRGKTLEQNQQEQLCSSAADQEGVV